MLGGLKAGDGRCRRRDSNPHTRRHRNLNPACLPVPPLRLCLIASLRSARIALWSPPTSYSLADDKACLLLPPQHGGARSVFNCFAPLSADRALEPAYFVAFASLADDKACLLLPPQHGGARSVFNCFAPLSADRALEPAYFVVPRGGEERLPSLLLSTAVRDPCLIASLSSVQIFQLQVSLELVDVAGGLDIVLSDCDGAVALLVDVDDEGGADDPLDELAVKQLLPVRAVGVER